MNAFVELGKKIWGSNSSSSFKIGAWFTAIGIFYISTKVFDNNKLSNKQIEQYNKKVLDDLKNKEKK